MKNSWIHFAIIGIIVLIAGIAVFRLYRWNQGTDREENIEQVDPAQFDVEALDMIIPMDASRLAGHEDDGELNILCLGNNPFSQERGEKGLAGQIAKDTKAAAVYDCSFPDSAVACKYGEYNPQYTRDHFNLFYVVNFLATQDFTAIESIAKDEMDPKYLEAVQVMKQVDMDKLDVIIIMYDNTDYLIGTPSDNPDNPSDLTAYTGSLKMSLDAINAKWPHIRVFVMTPTYSPYVDEDGKAQNITTLDLGNGPMPHYIQKEIDTATGSGDSVIDNYYGTINEDNYKEYFTKDGIYNEKGIELLAARIAYIINNRMGTVQSTVTE